MISVYLAMSGGVRDEYVFCNYIILEDYHQKAGEFNLWPWSWTFTVEHTIYVKCEYFMNREG